MSERARERERERSKLVCRQKIVMLVLRDVEVNFN